MARFKVPQISNFPFHITARCPNREPFPIALAEVWRIMEDYLYLAHHKNNLIINSFVLMPNHFHLIAQAPTIPIGKAMNEFMTETSKEMNRLSGRINQNWGGRFYRTLMTQHHYHVNCYKYVYQNPLRAGLCLSSEQWKFSTLAGLLGSTKMIIPLAADHILFTPELDLKELEWINTPVKKETLDSFRKALARREFKPAQKRNGQNHELQYQRF